MSDISAPGLGLAGFELPRPFVEPALRACRLFNTVLDAVFYDVAVLAAELRSRGEAITTQTSRTGQPAGRAAHLAQVDLGALSNPEGCILVIDAARAPYVTRFDRVDDFIKWACTAGGDVGSVTITGVGSSALGAAAMAWNVSVGLGQRVAAIVPGYGVADVANQALGGWFGFGVADFLGGYSQSLLARAAPQTARIGHQLLASLPDQVAATAALEGSFRTGNPASDVLHEILGKVPGITALVGHSKGALVIANAINALPAATTARLRVVTFGCPIAEGVTVAGYHQYLGYFDLLGMLNAWGNTAGHWLFTGHSTNTKLPASMPLAMLSRQALGHGGTGPAASLAAPGLSAPAPIDPTSVPGLQPAHTLN